MLLQYLDDREKYINEAKENLSLVQNIFYNRSTNSATLVGILANREIIYPLYNVPLV